MELVHRTLILALAMSLALACCGLAEACTEMASGSCCCEMLTGSPCEMADTGEDEQTSSKDSALQISAQKTLAVLPAAPFVPSPCTDCRQSTAPSTQSLDKPPDLFLLNCSFLC